MSKSTFDPKNLPKEKATRALAKIVYHALEDMKASKIIMINVKDISNVTDVMVIASGTSARHVKSISDIVFENCKKQGFKVLGVEGQDTSEWVLVDLGDVLVHVMQENTRRFYELEKLWDHSDLNNESNIETSGEIKNKAKNKTKGKTKTRTQTKEKKKTKGKPANDVKKSEQKYKAKSGDTKNHSTKTGHANTGSAKTSRVKKKPAKA